jgi:hypothetical protein
MPPARGGEGSEVIEEGRELTMVVPMEEGRADIKGGEVSTPHIPRISV